MNTLCLNMFERYVPAFDGEIPMSPIIAPVSVETVHFLMLGFILQLDILLRASFRFLCCRDVCSQPTGSCSSPSTWTLAMRNTFKDFSSFSWSCSFSRKSLSSGSSVFPCWLNANSVPLGNKDPINHHFKMFKITSIQDLKVSWVMEGIPLNHPKPHQFLY